MDGWIYDIGNIVNKGKGDEIRYFHVGIGREKRGKYRKAVWIAHFAILRIS